MNTAPALRAPSSAELDLLVRTIKAVACSRRLPREDAAEFLQVVQLTMLERNYDVFAKFSGNSSLKTYLTVVVTHLLVDWRNGQYGRWRPSIAATRLGPDALALERLISRDGYSADSAIAIFRTAHPVQDEASLRRVVEKLPARPRRRMVRAEVLDTVAARDFDDPVDDAERQRDVRRIRKALVRALAQLPVEEQRLIRLRYGCSHSVQAIGQQLQTDPKALYRRFDRILAGLRQSLASDGITAMA